MKTAVVILSCVLGIGSLGGNLAEAGGQRIAPFELPSRDGKTYTDRQLIGQPALLMFWTSWCRVCQSELPKVHALQDRLKRTPFYILIIGFADTGANIRNYVESQAPPLTVPVVYDSGNQIASQFDLRSTTTFFLLNKQGEIVVIHRGAACLMILDSRRRSTTCLRNRGTGSSQSQHRQCGAGRCAGDRTI